MKLYKSLDVLKAEDISMLSVDSEFFKTTEDIQFHLSRIRKKLHDIPVLLIIPSGSLPGIDFEWFFDEFLVYPFRKGELCARIRKTLWDKNLQQNENIISIGNIKINLKEYTVYINNVKQDFTYKEFELLRLFIENKSVVFSRKELLNRIWGMDYIGGTRTVDVHIRRLRGKLGDDFNTLIETVRNVGYKCKS
ncbi:MAG: response regulator transcription factor [Spirochaetes bacterium]|nr:response regulator transcription factor [Spirochaetota bacterium]